jgi:hypothetical protein
MLGLRVVGLSERSELTKTLGLASIMNLEILCETIWLIEHTTLFPPRLYSHIK